MHDTPAPPALSSLAASPLWVRGRVGALPLLAAGLVRGCLGRERHSPVGARAALPLPLQVENARRSAVGADTALPLLAAGLVRGCLGRERHSPVGARAALPLPLQVENAHRSAVGADTALPLLAAGLVRGCLGRRG